MIFQNSMSPSVIQIHLSSGIFYIYATRKLQEGENNCSFFILLSFESIEKVL